MAREEEEREIRDDVSNNSSDEDGDNVLDSSEEDDDEEDEEAMQKVREGFIVDDDEDDDRIKKRKKKKRRRERERSNQVEDDALDEDDLELLLENSGAKPAQAKSSGKFKRLKRARISGEDDEESEPARGKDSARDPRSGLTDIFSDDEERQGEEDEEEDRGVQNDGERNILDEFEDFIEEDEFSDDDDEARRREKIEQRQRTKKKGPRLDTSKLSNVDRESLQQLFEVFGNGQEYEWALEAQEIEDEGNGESLEPTSLDEVFEHAELKERMLTEEDNLIRIIDIPERFQKYRANLNYIDLEGEELQNEKDWVAGILFKEKQDLFTGFLETPFKEAVGKVVEFISKDAYEVPFIWTHRRDFLLFSQEIKNEEGGVENDVHKLLYEDDLWRIVQLDVEYHSLYEKRLNTEKLVELLNLDDDLVKDIKSLDTMVAVQDLHDYIQFTYSSEIRELAKKHQENPQEVSDNVEGLEIAKFGKKHSKYALFERIRSNILYDAVKAFGISAKEFGENVQDQSSKRFEVPYRIHATDDTLESPDDLIEKLCEDDEIIFKEEKSARDAVRRTFSEEIFHNPKIRHEVRSTFKAYASISVTITEKGRATIHNHSPYANIKYAINRSPADLVRNPDVLLHMLEAEAAGLAVIKVETKDFANWFQCIFNCLKSDGTSEISDTWNKERELVLNMAFKKLSNMIALNTKEDLRRECERLIASEVRRKFLSKLDQAPFTPFGFDKGTKPNVLALSFGKGDFDSAVVGVFLKESGKIDEFFKSENNPTRDRENEEQFFGQLKEFFDKSLDYTKPDVIVVSGYNANSKRLFDSVKKFVEENSITANVDDLPNISNAPLISVIWGQDETARLYQNSDRATVEFADKPTLAKYCIGVARYVQNPLLEYVALGEDILSLSFYEHQKLIPADLVKEAIESVFVDIVNMVGIEINEAVREPYIAQLLPYISGLGPRKSSGLIRNIISKLGSNLSNRSDLIENELSTANIFINCSSFLNIPFDEGSTVRDSSVELLDATRIHPEDYDLARKMAADALDLDEEDMAHVEEQGGIIYQLMQEGVNKVDELNLIAYGKELESKFGKKKYATLQIIKEELVNNFEELRRSYHVLESTEVFQMLTGETPETLSRNTIVPVSVTKVGKNYRDPNSKIRFAKVATSSLIQGSVEEQNIPDDMDLDQGQVVQAVVLEVFYDNFNANFSLLEEDLMRANAPKFVKEAGKWDFEAEELDLKKEAAKERAKLAKTRNIQHPLYHNFNFKQAEEFLAPQSVGDCVIRPSSKGSRYLTITWKVANNLFQHLLVEENTSGHIKEYIVDHKRYADLDQLIFQHIQSIAKKVDEMIRHPKFREGTLSEVNEWLESYTKANPKNSAYVFCFDHKMPGSFLLLFKVNVNTPVSTWHVRTEVDGYTLQGFSYPNMLRLCNGFKQTFKSYVSSSRSRPAQRPQSGYDGYGY
ncbi:transcription elongation factor Spt6 [Suhomyces tanzawaensis NRRL Y-17324]|uniref:Transcription elongation factor Spt6 n=1 Tax=Suhomyces tanzawaensis NRRL Y-17324 TaxID=984487 RepID=A0A1E4SJ06_9ASCO|nr:transcription elongation factor Spt6 [Suhomyces tanzawaensis NRRL Y-17324]ODV79478.1 transcription elongation factor Spt6 [Suhomyces tanzawaensis NRRL Y-17324]